MNEKSNKNLSKAKISNYSEMIESAENWDYACTFQLTPDAFESNHTILNLDNIELAYVEDNGAMIYDTKSKDNTISIAVMKEVSDKACLGVMKLQTYDIIIFDSKEHVSFIYNQPLTYYVVTIDNKFLKENKLFTYFSSLVNKKILDTNHDLSNLLNDLLQNHTIKEIDILNNIFNILNKKIAIEPKLTNGERISLLIKDEIYAHVDINIDIASLAKKHNISQRSLQTNFKSIFGFTPKYFFQLIKLNLAHQDLKNRSLNHTTVLRIANKWGFKHHGRFSQEYIKLFNEHPSETLQKTISEQEEIHSTCTMRKEEMGGGRN